MAKAKGEAHFKTGEGKDAQKYTLRFDFNVFCDLEEELGFPVTEFADRFGGEDGEGATAGFVELRKVVRVALDPKHGKLTLAEVGAIIQLAGIPVVSMAMQEAMQNAMPDAPAVKAVDGEGGEGKDGDPPTAGGTSKD